MIAKDKLAHFAISCTLVLLLGVLFPSLVIEICLAVLILGIGKEIYDLYTPGHYSELMDLVADLTGVLAGYGVLAIGGVI